MGSLRGKLSSLLKLILMFSLLQVVLACTSEHSSESSNQRASSGTSFNRSATFQALIGGYTTLVIKNDDDTMVVTFVPKDNSILKVVKTYEKTGGDIFTSTSYSTARDLLTENVVLCGTNICLNIVTLRVYKIEIDANNKQKLVDISETASLCSTVTQSCLVDSDALYSIHNTAVTREIDSTSSPEDKSYVHFETGSTTYYFVSLKNQLVKTCRVTDNSGTYSTENLDMSNRLNTNYDSNGGLKSILLLSKSFSNLTTNNLFFLLDLKNNIINDGSFSQTIKPVDENNAAMTGALNACQSIWGSMDGASFMTASQFYEMGKLLFIQSLNAVFYDENYYPPLKMTSSRGQDTIQKFVPKSAYTSESQTAFDSYKSLTDSVSNLQNTFSANGNMSFFPEVLKNANEALTKFQLETNKLQANFKILQSEVVTPLQNNLSAIISDTITAQKLATSSSPPTDPYLVSQRVAEVRANVVDIFQQINKGKAAIATGKTALENAKTQYDTSIAALNSMRALIENVAAQLTTMNLSSQIPTLITPLSEQVNKFEAALNAAVCTIATPIQTDYSNIENGTLGSLDLCSAGKPKDTFFSEIADTYLDKKSQILVSYTSSALAALNSVNKTVVGTGDRFSCALKFANSTGTPYCWGEVPDKGTRTATTTPTEVSLPDSYSTSKAFDMSVGDTFLCLSLDSGTTACKGGIVSTSGDMDGWKTIPEVYTRIASGYKTACGLTPSGVDNVYCWGDTTFLLGTDTEQSQPAASSVFTPKQIFGFNQRVTKIALGKDFLCGILADSTVKCIGNNEYGQLGRGNTETPTAMAAVSKFKLNLDSKSGSCDTSSVLTQIVDISAKFHTVCASSDAIGAAFGATSKTYCWGQTNDFDFAGMSDPSDTTKYTFNLFGSDFPNLKQYCAYEANDSSKQVSLGLNTYCNPNGSSVSCYGYSPVTHSFSSSNIYNISVGSNYLAPYSGNTCVSLMDGNINCWGADSAAQLGVTGPSESNSLLSVTLP